MFNPISEFPTTHVLIDNDINYLRSISTILPLQGKIYRYFLDAQEALMWINQQSDSNKHFLLKEHDIDYTYYNHTKIDIKNIYNMIYENNRFNSISTILVDYDMPGLNGIELCRFIKNKNIQKILITGFLGEKEARHALNKGWIDMFLPKGEDSSQKIAELINDADHNYFIQSNIFMMTLISHYGEKIFECDGFLKFFKEAFSISNSVEFYMLSSDGDYLFLDSVGMTTGFSVQNAKRRKENFELAQELLVSDDILDGLSSGKILFCHSGNSLPEAKDWEHFIFPACVIDKKEDLIGTFDRRIFADKSSGIFPFKLVFDKSINEAVKLLNGYR